MKTFLDTFDLQFQTLHKRSAQLILKIPDEKLYWQPRPQNALFPVNSCGENLLRSAAVVEQTFGGIMTKLWDDPFEWTLPEELSTGDKVAQYLTEVEETRKKGFGFFRSDDDLSRRLPAPEKLKSIFEILLETLARAENFQGRALAVYQMFSGEKLPRV